MAVEIKALAEPSLPEAQSIPETLSPAPDNAFLIREFLRPDESGAEPTKQNYLPDSDSFNLDRNIPVDRPAEVRPSDIPRLERYRFHSAILPSPYERCVGVYLPQAYEAEPERRFPVFYLHDGQNLFDDRTSYVPGHTWCAHLTADRLTEAGEIEPVILIGIANTGLRRMAEYTPTRDPRLHGGEGRSYGRLLIEELKPRIDSAYRTRPDAASTALGGSSLGGLISLFLGLEHPDVFGKLAVLSPSIWWNNRSILRDVESLPGNPGLRIWLDMGTEEGARHLRDADQLFRLLKRKGWREHIDLAYQRVEGGVHSEDAWADRFDDVLRFLFPLR